MDIKFREKFQERWERYFPGAELPMAFYYTDEIDRAEMAAAPSVWQCLLSQLITVRRGKPLCFGLGEVSCPGARRYLGFCGNLMPDFEYFLSTGIEGQLEGERYKKSPEIVRELMKNAPEFIAPAQYIVFKRWDQLQAHDEPDVVVFFATPDVLSGLFTLTGYEESDNETVVAPFSAGCGSFVQCAYLEARRERPRGVLGLFDVSARPWVPHDALSFAVPFAKFTRMVNDMDESFLTTHSWERVKDRMARTARKG